MVSCTGCISRTYVWYMNFVFFLAGIVMLGVGIGVYGWDILEWAGKELAIGTMVLGGFIMFVSGLALCGARKEVNKCAMGTYIFLLCALIAGQIAIAAVAVFKGSHFETFIRERWNDFQDSERDEFMKTLECGAYNTGEDLDCETDEDSCFDDCYNLVKDQFKKLTNIVAIVALCIMAGELLMLLFSCCLVCEESEEEKEKKRREQQMAAYQTTNHQDNRIAV